jgi:hypothetical protein
MRSAIEKILHRYGEQVLVDRKEAPLVFRGIFQHTGSKDWHNMEKAYSLLGQIPRGQYLVLAPVEVTLLMGDRLVVGGRRFSIRRVETVTWRGKPMYSWGLCVELGEEDTWPI